VVYASTTTAAPRQWPRLCDSGAACEMLSMQRE
jgi:hypothetical protein